MRRNILVLLFAVCVTSITYAAPGDTTIIQTFTYADGTQTPRTGKFEFPDGSIEYEKVLMYYTVKCDSAPNYCGGWDYDVHTDVFEETVDEANNPIYEVWRIGTYVTPYGGGINLGNGWTYILDVTDFLPLLKDSVLLSDGNGQELLDLKFVFIEGKPVRNVVNIRKVWSTVGFSVDGYWGGFPLSMFDSHFVKDTTFPLNTNEKQVKLRATVTGHYFGDGNNCGEFCPNRHSVQVNKYTTIHSWEILQECATNPMYPQSGTWIYDRAGWCPGMMATTNHFELTPYIRNNSITFDYDITYDPYNGVYHTYIFLVTYGDNNHTDDVSAETIIAPTDNPLYLRYNPMSGEPVIVIKNIGSNPLTSLGVKYGFKNGTQYTYRWTGNLPFLKMDTITLPVPNWDEVANASEKIFQFELLNPNGKTDPTPYNNKQVSSFQMPPVLTVDDLQFVFKTNHAPNETSWELFDMNNSILYRSPRNMSADTENTINMKLANGSYRLYIYDSNDDGLSFPFYGSSGSAVLKEKLTGSVYSPFHTFATDFGKETQFYFAVNQYVGVQNILQDLDVSQIIVSPREAVCNLKNRDIQVVLSTVVNPNIDFITIKDTLVVEISAQQRFYYPLTESLTGNSSDTFTVAHNIDLTDISIIKAYLTTSIDSNPSNDIITYQIATSQIDIHPELELTVLSMTKNGNCFKTGSQAHQEIILKNTGNIDLSNIELLLRLSAGEDFTEAIKNSETIDLAVDSSIRYTLKSAYTVPKEDYSVHIFAYAGCDSIRVNTTNVANECVDLHNLSMGEIVNPLPNQKDTVKSIQTLTVSVINTDNVDPFSKIVVRAQIESDNGEILNTLIGTVPEIAPFDTVSYTFMEKYIVPEDSLYFIRASIKSSDLYPQNDTIIVQRETIPADTNNIDIVSMENLNTLTLGQNIPNPANNTTRIDYSIPEAGTVIFQVHSISGQLLHAKTIETERGIHSIELNTNVFSAGIYFYSIEYKGQRLVKRMGVK
jgi:hypothetical protein